MMGAMKEKPTLSKSSPAMIHELDNNRLHEDLRTTLEIMPMKHDELTAKTKSRRKDKSRKKVKNKKETSEPSNELRSSRKKEKKMSLSSLSSSSQLETRESSNERRSSRKKKSKKSSSESRTIEKQLTKTKETETHKRTQILEREQRHTSDSVFASKFNSSTSSIQSNSSSFSRLSAVSALNRSEMQSIVERIRKDKMNIERRLSFGSCTGGVLSIRTETQFECERILQKWNSMNMERKEKFGCRVG